MAIDPNDVDRIYSEVMNGLKPARPDTDEEEQLRKSLQAELDQVGEIDLETDFTDDWLDED